MECFVCLLLKYCDFNNDTHCISSTSFFFFSFYGYWIDIKVEEQTLATCGLCNMCQNGGKKQTQHHPTCIGTPETSTEKQEKVRIM
jgi:hypothetical protein